MAAKILILYIDALRFDYLKQMPNLARLAAKGQSGKLESELGYASNLGAFFTGTKPNEHGLFTFFNCQERGDFYWLKPFLPLIRFFAHLPGFLGRLWIKLFFLGLNLVNYLRGIHYSFYLPGIDWSLLPKLTFKVRKHHCEEGAFELPSLYDLARKANLNYHFYMWPFYITQAKSKLDSPLMIFNHDTHRWLFFKKI